MATSLPLYLALKWLHLIGAAVLFGTGLGIAFFLFRAERKEDLPPLRLRSGPWCLPIMCSPRRQRSPSR